MALDDASARARRSNSKNKPGKSDRSGASLSVPRHSWSNYFKLHWKIAFDSLERMRRQKLASIFTCSVIGIALALPAILMLLLSNMNVVADHWRGSSQITLFLDKSVSQEDSLSLAASLRKRGSVLRVEFVSSQEALKEFQSLSGLSGLLDTLEENPLPNVLLVQPVASVHGVDQVSRMRDNLVSLPEVEKGVVDIVWLQRLESISSVLIRGVWLLATMLVMAVLLVLGNTIRLEIENRRDEIIVTKLVGGTDGFVRRPFLYTGTWFGLGGGILSFIFITIAFLLIQEPVDRLVSSYQSSFELQGLGFLSTILLLLISVLLGLLGAWMAVRRHLDDIEPS